MVSLAAHKYGIYSKYWKWPNANNANMKKHEMCNIIFDSLNKKLFWLSISRFVSFIFKTLQTTFFLKAVSSADWYKLKATPKTQVNISSYWNEIEKNQSPALFIHCFQTISIYLVNFYQLLIRHCVHLFQQIFCIKWKRMLFLDNIFDVLACH